MEQKELEAEELEEQDPVLNRREKRRQFLLDNYKDIFKIVLIVALVVFVIADYNNLSNLNIRDLLASRHSLAGSSFMVLFIYFIKGIVMVIPAAVVYISVGMAFPAWTAVILNTAGMIVELMASYFLGKFLSIDMIDRTISEQRGGNRIIARHVYPALCAHLPGGHHQPVLREHEVSILEIHGVVHAWHHAAGHPVYAAGKENL